MTKTTILNNPRWTKLSSKRQDELLKEYRDVNVDHNWWDYTYDWFKEKCDVQGICVTDMRFSGFWCQGDGANFDGCVDDWPKVLKAIGQEGFLKHDPAGNYWRFRVYSNSRYSYSGAMDGELEAEVPENPYDEDEEPLQHDAWNIASPLTEQDLDDLQKTLLEHCRDLAGDLYRALEEEYEYLTSDEVIVDWILDNLDDDELRDPDEDEPEQEDIGDEQVDHSRQLVLF
jgi:hypothetical protein